MRRRLFLLLLALLSTSCGKADRDQRSDDAQQAKRDPRCPARAPAPKPLPETPSELATLEYWLSLAAAEELDRPLLSVPAITAQDRALRVDAEGTARIADLTRVASREELIAQITERLDAYEKRLASGDYRTTSAHREPLRSDPNQLVLAPALYVALKPLELSCVPLFEPVTSTIDDPRIDRNRCSQARAQEPIELLGTFGPGIQLARTRTAWGFLRAATNALSPRVPADLEARFRSGTDLTLQHDQTLRGQALVGGTFLKVAETPTRAWLAASDGFHEVAVEGAALVTTHRPITRRSVLRELFSMLGTPYGWGDQNGGRDCSRLVLDVLARFGLHFPRTSAEQSLAGTYNLNIPKEADQTERLALLDEAQQRGLVLLHFPGHIMVYLGRDKLGVPRVFHSISEYAARCPTGGETLFEIGGAQVTSLSLGQGSSRRSLLERITRMTVLGAPPGQALLALTQFRRAQPPTDLAPKECNDSLDLALFRSPRAPHAQAPVRVIAATTEDTRPAGFWLVDPDGALHAPEVHELGVGPYARWVEVAAPKPGRWTALVADGERVLACEHFAVGKGPRADNAVDAKDKPTVEQPAWASPLRWERDTETFYAAFVEQLFTVPEGTVSWPALTPLLSSPTQNLLYNHLGAHEDERLPLAPDCADLPYFLRSYFAWKLGLPFAFRHCTRGRAGVPPRCNALVSNEALVTASDGVGAFEAFIRTQLASGVHSASGRTVPEDEETDLYPLPLRREALKPGSVFADPYGHVIVLAKWIPQGIAGAGMLLGVDAQPDATVALRRFWRGNFLFSPDKREVGAGFKAFRPIVRDAATKQLVSLQGEELQASRDFPSKSLDQYRGTEDDFYARMDELIYPRPITMSHRMQQVVDALHEQVLRRVEAVDVGEAGVGALARTIPMPEGYAIFETSGPWEDFATPSRDMRLLIAIDVVRALPDDVRKRPQRFGLAPQEAEARSQQVAKELDQLLQQRTFQYTRSDGTPQQLTLRDVLARGDALEVAYNPNDCVEARWGAPADSPELITCKKKAPPTQRALMERYRSWFHTRTRPPRS